MDKSKQGHPSFKQPIDPTIGVWKYLDFSRLLSLLSSNSIHLQRLDLLPDKFEGAVPKLQRSAMLATYAQSLAGSQKMSGPEMAAMIVENQLDIVKRMRKTFFVSCWRMGNHESEAMWRIYCPSGGGVAVVLSYANLSKSLEGTDSYLGCVRYVDSTQSAIPLGNAFDPAVWKMQEFSHENEARIVAWDMTHMDTPPKPISLEGPRHKKIPWVSETWIEKIIISPYAHDWEAELIRDQVGRLAPNLVNKVTKSNMSDGPGW